MSFDRDDAVARVDLAALCDELLGPRRGRGPSASWSCPDPAHGAQTGRTPPVTVFVSGAGDQRWHCHACGAGGTAIDLLMATHGLAVRDAIAELARRAGVAPDPGPSPRPRPRRPLAPPASPPAPDRCVADYVATCEQTLWSPAGARVLEYLHLRGLGDAVLRANRVGADPGPGGWRRGTGLPRRGAGAVFPLLDRDGRVLYFQTRYLDAQGVGRRYDNPASELAANPRVAGLHMPGDVHHPALVVVCEGMPDALTVAQAGYRAAVVIGAGLPDPTVARRLAERFGPARYLVAFDADDRGQRGAARLQELLARTPGAGPARTFRPPHGDLNSWAHAAGERFVAEFTRLAVIGPSPRPPAPTRVADAPPLSVGLA